jgi:hypothetical protein
MPQREMEAEGGKKTENLKIFFVALTVSEM